MKPNTTLTDPDKIRDFLNNWGGAVSGQARKPKAMTLNLLGPPPLSRQLRGRFVHRHKGSARRAHAFSGPTKLGVVETHKLENVTPTAIGDLPTGDSGFPYYNLTFHYEQSKKNTDG